MHTYFNNAAATYVVVSIFPYNVLKISLAHLAGTCHKNVSECFQIKV